MTDKLIVRAVACAIAAARVGGTLGAQYCVHTHCTIPELRALASQLPTAEIIVWVLTASLTICLVVDVKHAIESVRQLFEFLRDQRQADEEPTA